MNGLERYQRHLRLPEIGREGQDKLRRAKILCVGAGGLGSPAALYLAAAGIGRLGLVDADTVDLTNLQRQVLYTTADVGRPKLAAARERLRALNPDVEVVLHEAMLAAENALELVSAYDVIVDGTDNFAARYLINDACVLAGKPDVWGAVHRFEGQASVFWAAQGPCYRCLHPVPGDAPSCAEAGVLGALPGLIGSIQAVEAVKLVVGAGRPLIGRLLLCDGLSMEFRALTLRRDRRCPACGENRTIELMTNDKGSCQTGQGNRPSIPEITVEELKKKLDRKEDFLLIDVREKEEWDTARIPGAKLIPLQTLPEQLHNLPKAKEIVVHCHSGGRSSRATQFLIENGFKAANLQGGITAWSKRIDPSVPLY